MNNYNNGTDNYEVGYGNRSDIGSDYYTGMGDGAASEAMGVGFIVFIILLYAVIFFLVPFYMIAVTDASVKRRYWWILGMMVPLVNFVVIPVYYLTKLDKLPHHHKE